MSAHVVWWWCFHSSLTVLLVLLKINARPGGGHLPDPLSDQGLQVPPRWKLPQEFAVSTGEQTVCVSRWSAGIGTTGNRIELRSAKSTPVKPEIESDLMWSSLEAASIRVELSRAGTRSLVDLNQPLPPVLVIDLSSHLIDVYGRPRVREYSTLHRAMRRSSWGPERCDMALHLRVETSGWSGLRCDQVQVTSNSY